MGYQTDIQAALVIFLIAIDLSISIRESASATTRQIGVRHKDEKPQCYMHIHIGSVSIERC